MPEPRLADRLPVACAGCFGQHDVLHVDFSTAYEGPVVDRSNPRAGRVDWLVLCENCVRQAAAVLPDDKRAVLIGNLERQVEQLTARAEDAENYASRLEDSLSHRPERPATTEPRTNRAARPAAPRKPRYAPAT